MHPKTIKGIYYTLIQSMVQMKFYRRDYKSYRHFHNFYRWH